LFIKTINTLIEIIYLKITKYELSFILNSFNKSFSALTIKPSSVIKGLHHVFFTYGIFESFPWGIYSSFEYIYKIKNLGIVIAKNDYI